MLVTLDAMKHAVHNDYKVDSMPPDSVMFQLLDLAPPQPTPRFLMHRVAHVEEYTLINSVEEASNIRKISADLRRLSKRLIDDAVLSFAFKAGSQAARHIVSDANLSVACGSDRVSFARPLPLYKFYDPQTIPLINTSTELSYGDRIVASYPRRGHEHPHEHPDSYGRTCADLSLFVL